eukprot:CAMPEP_0180137048 /NCGR_PEP_ID=MMETSP0986-20121125/11937_1 /TAXON_ID=697907 /ORGANISM="non described non described, Strain CCMP2293" /LENGTH=145 /DNA_ID=CAMNT_0022078349 /DNA_START=626 /DNA_END=1063 /DNA_ORIENTATION=-
MIAWSGEAALKTLLPATIQFAPALAHSSMLAGPIPPSTSMSMSGHFALISATLGIMSDMKDCPPKPGSTVITRMRSRSAAYLRASEAGVAGFRAMPAFIFAALMALISAGASCVASMWNVNMSAPASAMSLTHFSGSETMRWTSK